MRYAITAMAFAALLLSLTSMVVGQNQPLSLFCALALRGQTDSAVSKARLRARLERVANLSSLLRWADEAGRQRYLATREAVTQQVFNEVDGFVADSVQPNMTVNQVTAALDGLLNQQGTPSVAFMVNLPNGQFLIVGVEVERGGPAISEDAISFRAYQNQSGKFVFITATNDLHSGDPTNPSLSDLKAKALVTIPVTGEFWFLTWARVNPQSPPTIALRLFTFDGLQFRTLWSSPDFRTVAYPFDNVVEVTSTGFVVTSAVDSTGGAAHSPDVIIHEQFALSVNGPVKIAESRSRRE